MTICNMSIEAGARAGLIAPDDTTFAYLEGRPFAPTGRRVGAGPRRVARAAHRRRRGLRQGGDASTRRRSRPCVSWGTNPAQTVTIDAVVPDPDVVHRAKVRRESATRALQYMGLTAGTPIRDIAVDTVFIGSCTNSRIEDLRAAADVVRGRR